MLDKVTIKGFKSIRSVEDLEIRPINALIGANGSGKSNFIEALAFLQAIRAGNLQAYVGRAGGANALLHFGAKTTNQITMRVRFQDRRNGYEITLDATDADRLYPSIEYALFDDKDNPTFPWKALIVNIMNNYDEAGISDETGTGIPDQVRNFIDSWRIYHFHDTSSSSPMKRTQDLHDNRSLRPDGSNLAAFLYLLREKHETSYKFIRGTVRQVAPFFEDFVLEPLALNENKLRLQWKHVGSDDYFDVSSLSDGTLRFIALATLLLQPKELRPSVILLDEPELGMHPAAIGLLAAMVKSVSVETQVILATQSPTLVDNFEPQDVLVADRVKSATEFTRLDSDKLAVWPEDYSLGELWQMGDLDGHPVASWKESQR